MRTAKITRKTTETDIIAKLEVDGSGRYNIQTPLNFFNHLLEAFTQNGRFDLEMQIQGDVEVDQHHTIEDCGIVLGQVFKKALEDRKGINRSGFFVYPMDDALALVAVDLGGRPYLIFNDVNFKRRWCGDFDTDLLEEFFKAFSVNSGANVVVKMPFGKNDHHKIEAIFKAFGKAMKMACSKDKSALEDIPSTKGVIEK